MHHLVPLGAAFPLDIGTRGEVHVEVAVLRITPHPHRVVLPVPQRGAKGCLGGTY